jgi:hypothetical protein
MGEVMEDHIREHVLGAAGESSRRHGAEELIDVVRAYLKWNCHGLGHGRGPGERRPRPARQ